MTFGHITDDQLLRHAHLALDPLTSTDLERELIARLEELVEENYVNAAALEVMREFDLDTTLDIKRLRNALQFAADHDMGEVSSLIDAAFAFDIRDGAALKPMLEIAKSIRGARDNPLVKNIALLHNIFNQPL